MQTPNHWCHVPGREFTNLTLEEWKNITIPREGHSFSKCLMYNHSDTSSDAKPVKCQHGWDYDTTWFSLTAPSQMNWVCDDQQAVSDILTYAQIIGTILALLIGYLGDMYGRRLQQMLCVTAHVVSRLLVVVIPNVVLLFIFVEALVAAVSGPMYESSLSVGMELTDISNRATLNRYACCSTSFGLISAAVLAWALRSWTYFIPFTALGCIALFLFSRWFPESPRWLACRGREQEAMRVLRRIALVNGTEVPPFAEQVMRTVAEAKAERKGFLSLFSSWNVFKNTVVLVIARAVQLFTLYSLLLMVGGLGVDPFVTLAAQGAMQLPAYCTISCCAVRFGRRWPAVGSPLLVALSSAGLHWMLSANMSGAAVTAMLALVAFATTASMGMSSLQTIELHPTCLRQIAASVEWGVAGVVMAALPYLALMNDRRTPFAILAAMNVGAALAVSFLPESALQRLPESLQDAAVFGRGQPYWSWKPRPQPARL